MSAPTIFADEPGTFPFSVLTERHPALIEATRRAYPYPPEIDAALVRFTDEIMHGAVTPLPSDDSDADDWNQHWNHGYIGRPWTSLPWLQAESYFYRRLLDTVRYFEPGPWRGVDPFAPAKRDDLSASAVDDELASYDRLAGRPVRQRFLAFVQAALWGNRADLGFNVSRPAAAGRAAVSTLVIDDRPAFWEYVLQTPRANIGLIADNAGRELIPDLMLVDLLLHGGFADRVTLHLKPYPYFVSDAVGADVDAALDRMAGGPRTAAGAAARLRAAEGEGRLHRTADRMFCAPVPYRDQLDELLVRCGDHDLTILKGDLNYRRLIEDRYWPATASFADLTSYFPGPLVALRTLKSDAVVGLAPGQEAELDATGDDWRKSGRYAMVQARW